MQETTEAVAVSPPPPVARRLRVLVVGQTPPPYVGQSIMIDYLLRGPLERTELHHVRMNFSRDADDIGAFRTGKITELFRVVAAIWRARLTEGINVLYYPPVSFPKEPGAMKVGFYRDLAVLLPTRWLFKKTIFHFHASGQSDMIRQARPWERLLARLAFHCPAAAIRISALAPEDGKALHARREYVVANGIEDVGRQRLPRRYEPFNVLFVPFICEAKGAYLLLEAIGRLKERGVEVHARFMGRFDSPEIEAYCRQYVTDRGLDEQVEWLGVCTGERKWQPFSDADLFCLPTHYGSETFPVTLLEAAAFGIPSVSTRWRGIPSIVVDGETGVLLPPRDAAALTQALLDLYNDAAARARLGANARRRFLENFSLAAHLRAMEDVFVEVSENG